MRLIALLTSATFLSCTLVPPPLLAALPPASLTRTTPGLLMQLAQFSGGRSFGSHILPSNQQIGRTLTWILFVVWVAGLEVLVFRKMRAIHLPVKYLKAFYRGRAVFYIGFLVMMGTFI